MEKKPLAKVKIRKIRKADLPACARILKSAYRRPPHHEHLAPHTARQYLEEKYQHCRQHSFVAINNIGDVIGFQLLYISAWTSGPQAILEELAVDPKIQGQGIGKRLLNHTHHYLRSHKVKSAMLWARKDPRLLKIYRKQGYRQADDFVIMFKIF